MESPNFNASSIRDERHCWDELYAGVKEGTSAVLLQCWIGWTNGGLVLWSALAICEMSKTSWQTWTLLMRGDSESFSKNQLFRLEQWLNIIRFQPEIKQDFSKLVRKFYQVSLLGYALIAGENFERRYSDRKELENLDASEVYPRTLNAKEVLKTQSKGEFVLPVADGTAKLLGRDYEF